MLAGRPIRWWWLRVELIYEWMDCENAQGLSQAVGGEVQPYGVVKLNIFDGTLSFPSASTLSTMYW